MRDQLVLVRPEVRLNSLYMVGVTFRIRQSYDRFFISPLISSTIITTHSTIVPIGPCIISACSGIVSTYSTIITVSVAVAVAGSSPIVTCDRSIVPSPIAVIGPICPAVTRIPPRIITGVDAG